MYYLHYFSVLNNKNNGYQKYVVKVISKENLSKMTFSKKEQRSIHLVCPQAESLLSHVHRQGSYHHAGSPPDQLTPSPSTVDFLEHTQKPLHYGNSVIQLRMTQYWFKLVLKQWPNSNRKVWGPDSRRAFSYKEKVLNFGGRAVL